MQFEKDVIFLGYKDMTLKDGSLLRSVSFYVDDETLTVNVLGTNLPLMAALAALSFADKCCANFTLRKADKFYRLSLTGLANV